MAENGISRRVLMGHTFAAVSAVAFTATPCVAYTMPDPALAFIERWNTVSASLESGALASGEVEDYYIANVAPFEEMARDGKIPDATTASRRRFHAGCSIFSTLSQRI